MCIYARVPCTSAYGKCVKGSRNLGMGSYRSHQELKQSSLSYVFHPSQHWQMPTVSIFSSLCDAQYLPKYGSFGHPFKRTPFWVHSIRKCLTSSFDKSPTVLKKKVHEKKQLTDTSHKLGLCEALFPHYYQMFYIQNAKNTIRPTLQVTRCI